MLYFVFDRIVKEDFPDCLHTAFAIGVLAICCFLLPGPGFSMSFSGPSHVDQGARMAASR